MKRIQYALEWATVAAIRKALSLLPWRVAVAIGAAAGELAYWLAVRRRVVLANLTQAFPEWDGRRKRRTARRVYHYAWRGLVESFLLQTLSPDKMDRLVEGIEGFDLVRPIIEAQRPFIVVTGHIGNWEMMGAYFARQGYRLKVFAKPLHNPVLEADLLAARRAVGLDVIYTGEGLKPALRHLRDGGVLVFLADQDARRAGIAVPFFGAPASTALGPAMFAYLGRAPIVPVFAIRVGTLHHRYIISPPIEPLPGEKREAALERMTRAHVEALERIIRKYPEQYFWFHRRWKTGIEKLARDKTDEREPLTEDVET
jgi:KDO2-lipid IV(A) lauroyltransferase